jgi:undecaprenyl phosphate-alpha-L-ara4N flippase subunit ArnF
MTRRRLGIACLVASIVLSALGQLGMKAGMLELHRSGAADLWSIGSFAAWRPALLWTVAGLTSYALSLLAWLAVLARYRLSYAYPLLGVSYVLVYIGATQWPVLMEPATTTRTVGTLLIIAGVALVSLTRDRAAQRAPLREHERDAAEDHDGAKDQAPRDLLG